MIEQDPQINGKCFAGKNAGGGEGEREIERMVKRRHFKYSEGTCNYIH